MCIPGFRFSRCPLRTSCFATSPLPKCVFRPPKADHLERQDCACLGVSRLFYNGLSWPIHTSAFVFCYKSLARMVFFDPLSSHFLVFPRIFLAFPCFFLVFSSHYLVFPCIFLRSAFLLGPSYFFFVSSLYFLVCSSYFLVCSLFTLGFPRIFLVFFRSSNKSD